jgi:hypothetical protein
MPKTASQRRFARRAAELASLRAALPERFQLAWAAYARGWLVEVRNRARAQRAGDCEERRLRIFGVLAQAQALAQEAGVHADAAVVDGLAVLAHECAKAVAAITDLRLYSFNEDSTTRIRNLSVKNRTRD